jgi:hypothetical protein
MQEGIVRLKEEFVEGSGMGMTKGTGDREAG